MTRVVRLGRRPTNYHSCRDMYLRIYTLFAFQWQSWILYFIMKLNLSFKNKHTAEVHFLLHSFFGNHSASHNLQGRLSTKWHMRNHNSRRRNAQLTERWLELNNLYLLYASWPWLYGFAGTKTGSIYEKHRGRKNPCHC